MSEVKVNKISPRSGTGVQLGDSGDTFTIPSGATINNQGTAVNFGATGSASWTSTVKTSTFTAVAGEGYFVNTTGGAVTANLPAGTAGAVVAFKDYASTFQTNNLTIAPNGSDKIGALTTNVVLNEKGVALTLVFIDSTQGWLVTDSGLQSEASGPKYVTATGGTPSTVGDFKIHTFTGPGTFCVSCSGNSAGSNSVDYLVVAGGGAGGGANGGGGGGGAGGFRLSNSTCMPSPQTSPLATPTALPVSVQGYTIQIGGGGPGGTGAAPPVAGFSGGSGTNSTFSTITSTGGGGAGGSNPNGTSAGKPGGSGGGEGGAGATGGPGTGNTPPVSPAQGTNGGNTNPAVDTNSGSGGGGASVAGSGNSSPLKAGDGGAGSFVVQTGFAGCNGTPGPVSGARYFSGGGGGSSENTPPSSQGAGGTGGGTAGAISGQTASNAANNTGGGGGGIDTSPTGQTSGNGGSGIVIIRYKFQN